MTNRLDPKDIPEEQELKYIGMTPEGPCYKLVPKMPERPESGFSVYEDGDVVPVAGRQAVYDFYNIFRNRDSAERHRDRTRVQNAIATAVEQIEPDFVPDYSEPSQYKFEFYKDTDGKWRFTENNWECYFIPVVSSSTNAERVIELLEKWGV